MAKRSKSAAEAVQLTPDTLTSPQLPDITPPQRPEIVEPLAPESPQLGAEQPAAEQPARQWRANPFPINTVNLDGYKVQLQESRPAEKPWQMQIKFGDGSRQDMPSDAVREFIKSQRLKVTTKEGQEKEYQFHWNDVDRAWGITIASGANAATRDKAHRVFNEAVELVAQERGAGRER
jgi:hypothetical protein